MRSENEFTLGGARQLTGSTPIPNELVRKSRNNASSRSESFLTKLKPNRAQHGLSLAFNRCRGTFMSISGVILSPFSFKLSNGLPGDHLTHLEVKMNVSLKIPRFVLKHGLDAIGPANQDLDNGEAAFVIYGFSDKPEYDLFRSQDTRLLKPYPLVARFLIDELRNGTIAKQLVVLDAMCSKQEVVFATGMRELLDAFNDKLDKMDASHELILDGSTEVYQLKRIHDNEHSSAFR